MTELRVMSQKLSCCLPLVTLGRSQAGFFVLFFIFNPCLYNLNATLDLSLENRICRILNMITYFANKFIFRE